MNPLFPFRFECQRCGSCCSCGPAGGIPLYIADVQRLALHLQLSIEDFLSKYCRLTYVVEKGIRIPILGLGVNHDKCPFLQQESCSVHQFKPYLCQAAPIISVLFENRVFMREFKAKCKGYGKGSMISVNEIKLTLQQEAEMELADKEAYQNGWHKRLLQILALEVSHDSATGKSAFEKRTRLKDPQKCLA